jgi:hypothetical protein
MTFSIKDLCLVAIAVALFLIWLFGINVVG